MEVENLIPIILTVLAVSGLFLYYYLNREDNKDNTQINFEPESIEKPILDE